MWEEEEGGSAVARMDGGASWCGGVCPKSWSAGDQKTAEVVADVTPGQAPAVAAASENRGEVLVGENVAAAEAAAEAAAADAAAAVAAAEKRTMIEVMADVADEVADGAAVDAGVQDHQSQRRMRNRQRVAACREAAHV